MREKRETRTYYSEEDKKGGYGTIIDCVSRGAMEPKHMDGTFVPLCDKCWGIRALPAHGAFEHYSGFVNELICDPDTNRRCLSGTTFQFHDVSLCLSVCGRQCTARVDSDIRWWSFRL